MENTYDKTESILLQFIDEIEKCIEHECFLAALGLALTLPDICGKAKYPRIKNNGERYKRWCDDYVMKYEMPWSEYSEDMPYISSEIIYQLRNSFLHQGTFHIQN